MSEKMARVIVTKPMQGLVAMQVCAISDVTDEEILEVCNRENPSGTSLGWSRVIRKNETGDWEKARPVQCADYEDRNHFIVLC